MACYGMNDGIYHPFEEQRFLAYQTGINTLIAQVHASGGKVVLLTPPPFDPVPLRGKGKLGSMDEQEHGFRLIFEDYNDVLQRYAEWIRDQKDRVACVVDLYAPVMRQLGKARKEAPDFTFANDGVHLNRDGHRILANAILAADGITPSAFEDSVLELEDLVHQRQLLWHNAYLSAVGHQRPGMKEGLPLDEIPNAVQDLTRQINEAVERIRSERSKTEKVKSTSTQN